jgi:hypothetical protein
MAIAAIEGRPEVCIVHPSVIISGRWLSASHETAKAVHSGRTRLQDAPGSICFMVHLPFSELFLKLTAKAQRTQRYAKNFKQRKRLKG